MKTFSLYLLTFPSGKSYIGITAAGLKRRVIVHRHHARKGRDCALHRAIRKYGEFNFSARVLMVTNDWAYLCEMERRAISSFGCFAPKGYNLTIGGEGVIGVKLTAAQRMARSVARKGKNIGNKFALGYRHTVEAKEKIAAAGRGAVFSEERREKIGATKIGNKFCAGRVLTEEQKARISNAQKGKPRFSEEQKRQLSLKRKGRPWTPARRAAQDRRAAL